MNNNKMLKNNNKNKVYVLPYGKTVDGAAQHLKNFLERRENMNAQMFQVDNGCYVVQARSRGGKIKQFAGMDKVLSVKLTPVGADNMVVEIGKGKWIDKLAGGGIAWFIAWPFAITTAYGTLMQGTLPLRVTGSIEKYLAA